MCGGKVALPPIVKEKRRNSEKRKEKSRDAARCRRSKESDIFNELSSQLPLPVNTASQLDKASVMRLTVGYLKMRDIMNILFPDEKDVQCTSVDSLYATVLNGFLLVLSEEGDIIYLSENVDEVIGISQVEMVGQSIYEFAHPCDHDEIKSLLTSTPPISKTDILEKETISFFIRMKSLLKSKTRTINLKSSTYQVIHYIGHRFDKPLLSDSMDFPTFYLVFIGKTIPHPAHVEIPLDKEIFFSRHSPDMKFTHIDERISEFLGFENSELIGHSVYSYHHALDASSLVHSFKTLFSKGQCETGYYRFLSKYGGYVWVVTQATLIYENSTKPECVVCLNYVLSKVENKNEIVSAQQDKEETLEGVAENLPLAQPTLILSSTCSIFAPKKTVMSKDFLNFSDTDILLFQEPLKESKLTLELDLFHDDPCTIGSSISDDPFITYREDSLSSPSYCGTPESLNMHTSNSTSPDPFNTTPSTPDSGSLSGLDPTDDFSNLDLKFTMTHSVCDKESDKEGYEEAALEFRAPFISMNMDDDFPLISPSNSVMWGPQEPAPKKAVDERLLEPSEQRITPPKPKPPAENPLKSSLAALLQSDVKKVPPPTSKPDKNSRKDIHSQKKWTNSHGPSVDSNNRHNNNSKPQKHFVPPKSYYGNGGGGHIIMLDTIPIKKHQSSKPIGNQRRNGHPQTANSNHHSHSTPFGSHTATVKVNDRLIKVQVSLSELPNTSIEQKQPFPSPPDPPPKRTRPSRPAGPTESPKRLKVDNNGLVCAGPQGIASDSVLFNLLISGEDASHGYLCSSSNRSENKLEPAVLSLSTLDSPQSDSSEFPELPVSESEIIDSFLNISQYDAEINAPIQSSYLLQGDDLLSALDNQPLLRNISALV